jgi:hypothetical protein
MAIEWLLVKRKAVKSGKEHHKVRNMFINNCIFSSPLTEFYTHFLPFFVNLHVHFDIEALIKRACVI